jgi:AraC family transcriptional regulator of adaptative response / DNA-3-methyladenine glycosylase II
VAEGSVRLERHADVAETMAALEELPGIGAWTAHYIAMRALRWPDAFPASDLGVRKALGGLSAKAATERAEAWRPWRAYAVLHLWTSLSDGAGG